MIIFGIHKKLTSWMAIFAVLSAFFAPTVSQAISVDSQSNVIYQQVCDSNGNTVAPVELPSKNHNGALGHTGHCPFCFINSHTPLITSSSFEILVPSNESHAWFTPTYDSPVIQSTHQDSHPAQAPPSV